MFQRTSHIDRVHVKIVSFASILQIGDSRIIYKLSRALANQREKEQFNGNEGSLAPYQVFSRPIPLPPINEQISYARHHLNPIIKVKNIDITAISSASMLNVGSSQHISMEARVKHIRQLEPIPHEVEEQSQE